jgi:hypothetical protein
MNKDVAAYFSFPAVSLHKTQHINAFGDSKVKEKNLQQ